MTVSEEKAPANYVPAAAVIRRVRALIGMTGRKGCVGGLSRRRWNPTCSSEMRRDVEEHRWRRQPPGPILTLRHESVGANRIRYPGSPCPKRCQLVVGDSFP